MSYELSSLIKNEIKWCLKIIKSARWNFTFWNERATDIFVSFHRVTALGSSVFCKRRDH